MSLETMTLIYVLTVALIIVTGLVFLKYYSKTHQGEDDAKNAGKVKFCKNEYGDVVRPSELKSKAKLTMKKEFFYIDPAPRRVTAYAEGSRTEDNVELKLTLDFMAYIPADFLDMAAQHVFGMNDEAIDELLEELASNAVTKYITTIKSTIPEDEMKTGLQKCIHSAVYSFGYSAGKVENLKIIRQ